MAATLCNAEKTLPFGTAPNTDCQRAAAVPKLLASDASIQGKAEKQNIGGGRETKPAPTPAGLNPITPKTGPVTVAGTKPTTVKATCAPSAYGCSVA